MPEWQQEFLKSSINEYNSTWEDIISKAEALETAEVAIAESAPANEKRDLEEGEIASATKPSPKKKAKKSFYCRLHGPDQNHKSDTCKVILAEIEKLQTEKSQGRKPSFSNTNNNQQGTKSTWTDRKRPATSYSTEQLKEVVRMTKKKVMQEAKAKYDSQLRDDLNAMEINEHETQEREKMHSMEVFMNNIIDEEDSMEEEDELTQAELDELTTSLSV